MSPRVPPRGRGRLPRDGSARLMVAVGVLLSVDHDDVSARTVDDLEEMRDIERLGQVGAGAGL